MKEGGPESVRVAVPAPLPDPLSYRVPPALAPALAPGMRVRVPLGSRQVIGVVFELEERAPEGVALRDVQAVLDEAGRPSLPPDLLATVRYAARYYLAPPGEVVRAALPVGLSARRSRAWVRVTEQGRLAAKLPHTPEALRWLAGRPGGRVLEKTFLEQLGARALPKDWVATGWIERHGEEARPRGEALIRVIAASEQAAADPEAALAALSRAPAQARLLRAALGGPARPAKELMGHARAGDAALRAALEAGVLVAREEEAAAAPVPEASFPVGVRHVLSEAQDAALSAVTTRLDEKAFHAALLFGVTGSGKTEVYLRAAEHCLASGRPVLFLVPEIGLTPHLTHALRGRFGEEVVVLHSGISDRQRHDAWQRARRGTARIVVGARSALFAPLAAPGLIVVDEEHDGGYKQEEAPRYHARDLALVRAREAGAVALLGSATPSMEAWALAHNGKAERLDLPTRVGGARLADVELVDMRREFKETGDESPLSRRLVRALEETVLAGDQAMVLLNRRGYTRALHCRACGEPVGCQSCSIALTWHKVGEALRCHYCGHAQPRPERCPSCESPYLADVCYGTQRAEEALSAALPEAKVARLDRDVVRSPQRLAETLGRFARGELHVLVGTQMIAKGHHFPRVTLVGVLSADSALGMPDFRAAERTFQLLTQVAGRAGRGHAPGRVIVQAFRPEHPALQSALKQDFGGFVENEWAKRRLQHYPPEAALANLLIRDEEQLRAHERAVDIAEAVKAAGEGHVQLLGPTSAPIARIKKQWRVQLLLRAQHRTRIADALHRALAPYRDETGALPRWLTVDIDPHSLM